MEKAVGRSLPVSLYRRLVTDLMHFSQQVPSVSIERHMDLSSLIAARQACYARPSWTVIFAKAYSIVAQAYPELRRCYLKFPRPRFYEHPNNIVALNVERRVGNEDVVLFCLIRAPENRPLPELDAIVRHHKEAPIEQLRSYQRSVGVSRIPWPFRRGFWWCALNVFGRRRCHNFGTFSISSVASQGAGILHIVPLLTSSLHYGLFDENGGLDVRITFDHRVMDGAVVARALVDLERALHREILSELRQLGRRAA